MKQRRRKIVLLLDNASVHLILDETKEKLDSIDVKISSIQYRYQTSAMLMLV